MIPHRVIFPIEVQREHADRLKDLQRTFAHACNLLAPFVQGHRCWNRVTLHHLAYRSLRRALPALGSQMACNAIYSVCRSARLAFQHPNSPFNVGRWGDKPLPLLRFADNCPVYFDRHTFSLRNGRASLFTLDGRLRFDLALSPKDEAAILAMRMREVVLSSRADGGYELTFLLQDPQNIDTAAVAKPVTDLADWPEYLKVEETE